MELLITDKQYIRVFYLEVFFIPLNSNLPVLGSLDQQQPYFKAIVFDLRYSRSSNFLILILKIFPLTIPLHLLFPLPLPISPRPHYCGSLHSCLMSLI